MRGKLKEEEIRWKLQLPTEYLIPELFTRHFGFHTAFGFYFKFYIYEWIEKPFRTPTPNTPYFVWFTFIHLLAVLQHLHLRRNMCCGSEPSQQQTNTYLSSSSMRTMTLPFRVTEGRPVLKEDAEALRVFLDAIGSVPPLHFTKKARGTKGPIFEDGPNFDMAFRRFHGQNDVVPLSEGSLQFPQTLKVESMSHQFNPLAAKAATISLSSFGGPFGFDEMFRKEDMETKVSTYQDIQIKMICRFIYDHSGVIPVSQQLNGVAVRHAIISLFGSEGPFGASNEMSKEQQKSLNKVDSSEITVEPMYSRLAKVASISISNLGGSLCFDTFIDRFKNQQNNNKAFAFQNGKAMHGNSRFASSSVSNFQPIVAMASNRKYKCLAATTSATNMITKHMPMMTTFFMDLINQPMFMVLLMGMGANFVLGMLREHSQKHSPPWLTAILVTIPFLPILCSPVLMPKTTMVYTLGVSVLGQVLGSMAEQSRQKAIVATAPPLHLRETKASVVGGVVRPPFHYEVAILLWRLYISLHVSSHKFSLFVDHVN